MSDLSPLAQFAIMMGGIFAVLGVFMEVLQAAFDWNGVTAHHTRNEFPRTVEGPELRHSVNINSAVSTGMYVVATFVFFDQLLYSAPAPLGRVAFEIAAMLLIYDGLYYMLHRYAFHEWERGRRWHSVHHRIRSPRAKDSLFIHPMETFLGVATMLVSIVVTGLLSAHLLGGPGGVHTAAFGAGFFIYSALNIYVHSGVQVPTFPLRLLSTLSRNHDAHHTSMRGGYYASITPLWDTVFGTNRETVPVGARKRNPEH